MGVSKPALLAAPRGRLDERRGVPLREVDAIAADFQPALQQIKLRAFSRAVDPFDDDKRARDNRAWARGLLRELSLRPMRMSGVVVAIGRARLKPTNIILPKRRIQCENSVTNPRSHSTNGRQSSRIPPFGPKRDTVGLFRPEGTAPQFRGSRSMATNFSDELMVPPGKKVSLVKYDPEDTLGWEKGARRRGA